MKLTGTVTVEIITDNTQKFCSEVRLKKKTSCAYDGGLLSGWRCILFNVKLLSGLTENGDIATERCPECIKTFGGAE